jgi:hypothetical protein
MNGRLLRKTLGYSKENLRCSEGLESGRRLYTTWRGRTKRCAGTERGGRQKLEEANSGDGGGAEGSHIWEIEELLTMLPLPMPNTT